MHEEVPITHLRMKSSLDKSVNFITNTNDGGFIESRFVQRTDDHFIVYVSSHSGCNKACRFCHLTQTHQTMMTPVDHTGFLDQLKTVLQGCKATTLPKHVHINFMARGEPLSNPDVNDSLFPKMWMILNTYDIANPAFKISTIMPSEADLNRLLTKEYQVDIYYSLYSMNEDFRRRWLPKSQNPNDALLKLKEGQDKTGGMVKIHHALIKDENDSTDDAKSIIDAVQRAGLRVKFNLVRYNPPNGKSVESPISSIHKYFEVMRRAFGEDKAQIVPRVGPDVFASCGMFYQNSVDKDNVESYHDLVV